MDFASQISVERSITRPAHSYNHQTIILHQQSVSSANKILLVDASSFITLVEADAQRLLYDRKETIWVPEHVLYEVIKDPAQSELHRAMHSRDVYIDSTDQFNTHFPYFRAASFHLDEKTYYRHGEMLWSGDTALIGRGLSMEKVVIVTDDGYGRSRCDDLNLEVKGSLGILLDGVKKDILSMAESIRYLNAIKEGCGRFNQGLLDRVRHEIRNIE